MRMKKGDDMTWTMVDASMSCMPPYDREWKSEICDTSYFILMKVNCHLLRIYKSVIDNFGREKGF